MTSVAAYANTSPAFHALEHDIADAEFGLYLRRRELAAAREAEDAVLAELAALDDPVVCHGDVSVRAARRSDLATKLHAAAHVLEALLAACDADEERHRALSLQFATASVGM